MAEVIRWAPVEKWAVEYMTAALAGRAEPEAAGVYVSNEVPTERKIKMVSVNCDGGQQVDLIRRAPRLRFRVWAGTDYEANLLAELSAALVKGSVGGPVQAVTYTTTPVRVGDPSEQPLWFFTAELLFRGYAA